MADRNYNVITAEDGVPIKAWTVGVPFEAEAESSSRNVAALPFIHKWVAVMPDVHCGMGATVGSVIADAGRDHSGRGRRRHRLRHDGGADQPERGDLPDDLRAAAHGHRGGRAARPHRQRRRATTRRVARRRPRPQTDAWAALKPGYDAHRRQAPAGSTAATTSQHLGTLGTGNHFIEVCLDEEEQRLVHAAQRIARRGQPHRQLLHRAGASEDMRTLVHQPAGRDLAYFPEGTEHFDDYVEAVELGAGLRPDRTAS